MEGLRVAAQVIAVGLALSALYRLARQRTRERFELALFFIAFGTGPFFTFDISMRGLLVVTLGTAAAPYLLLRLAAHFQPVPRVVSATALVGALATAAASLFFIVFVAGLEGTVLTTAASPGPLAVSVQNLYLLFATGYATWIFVRTAVRMSGITAWRARLAAAGSVVLAVGAVTVTILVMSQSEAGVLRPPAEAGAIFSAFVAGATILYFAAFATPPWALRLWQLGELHRFLRATAHLSVGEKRSDALAALVTAAERVTGGNARVLGPDAAVSGRSVVAAPIVAAEQLFGVLTVTYRTPPLFPKDDADMLRLMTDQTAIALANDELFRQRRELEERERRRVQAELDRVAEELAVARNIQLSLLPTSTPEVPGWRITSFYRPARSVGGDLYDFFALPDGSLAVLIGDASGDGIPAALLMATARSVIRSVGAFTSSPGEILARANENMVGGIPPNTFVTCMIVALEPASGRARYANAGHDVAYAELAGEARELRARGMPLGAMPGMSYEEIETVIRPGEMLVLYTDGIVEAHDPGRQLFSFGRMRDLVARASDDPTPLVMSALEAFTGPGWEQEDDITMVSVRRTAAQA
jgi:serine phosphatase RsbU (regulator of sigma subunit)